MAGKDFAKKAAAKYGIPLSKEENAARYQAYIDYKPEVPTVEDFMVYVGKLRTDWPEWRAGQCWYNGLDHVRPDLAERVIGSELDPFHNDKNIYALRAWLRLNWG